MRVFDHLDGAPEDARFSRVARKMRSGPWWQSITVRDEPAAVSGELTTRDANSTEHGGGCKHQERDGRVGTFAQCTEQDGLSRDSRHNH